MQTLINKLKNDEAGFIISAELVLVATIAVIGVVVGLTEVAWNVNEELEDVGSAFASIDQSFSARGACGHQGVTANFRFKDHVDYCACENDLQCGW